MKAKKGLSEVIGYILLIVIAISISLLIYAWLKNYLPKEADKCPDSVSLSLEEYKCVDKTLELSLMNRGYFNLDGFIAKISNKTGYLPTLALSKISGPIVLGRGEIGFDFADVMKPDEKISSIVLNYSLHNEIVEIEIIPFMYKKTQQILCDSAVLRQELKNCVSEISGCISTEVPEATCDDNLDNDCDELIDCDDSDCDGNSACVVPVCVPANTVCDLSVLGVPVAGFDICSQVKYKCITSEIVENCGGTSCQAIPCGDTSPFNYLCTGACIGNPPIIPPTCVGYPSGLVCLSNEPSPDETDISIHQIGCGEFSIYRFSHTKTGKIKITGNGCTDEEVEINTDGVYSVCV